MHSQSKLMPSSFCVCSQPLCTAVQGAQQLATDTDALVGCFRPYTPRPASHLRELVEASNLLLLDEPASAALQVCWAARLMPHRYCKLAAMLDLVS